MQAVTIHKATAEDAAQIAAMAQELALYEGESSQVSAASIAKILTPNAAVPNCECFMARIGEEAAGFVLYYAGYDLSSDSYGFHLADMLVREVYRGKGVGKKLLAALAKEAQKQSREWLSLTALQGNVVAKNFYDKSGFQCVDVRFYAIGPNGLAALAKQLL